MTEAASGSAGAASPDPAAATPALRLDGVTRRFGDTLAVDDVSLDVHAGELLTLLGPSGCGKTTTLRMIAGFETPDAGRVVVEGKDVTALPPQKRGVGMVFQNYALFPHLDVFENVAFGLKTRGEPADRVRERVADSLARVDLPGFEKRKVQQLSGGQQQRVALARALAPEPPLLLLDEPLSNLDAALRERTRDELRELLERLGITSIFVTHDQEEAFALADRVAVMRAGRVEQLGTPERLYRAPATAFVANFVGRANLLDATVRDTREDADGPCALCQPVGWSGAWWARLPADATLAAGDAARVMARPEDLELVPPPATAPGEDDGVVAVAHPLAGRVDSRRFAGAVVRYGVAPRAADGDREIFVHARDIGLRVGDVVAVAPRLDAAILAFPA